jgi:hypothetical protein
MEQDNSKKIILDLCGGTGAWSKPYKDAGYDVRVITLPEYDVMDVDYNEMYMAFNRHSRNVFDLRIDFADVYGIMAAPPCTEFAGSGARWWANKDPLLLAESVEVVMACMRIIDYSNPAFWALENPVGRLKNYIGSPRMYFNPCDYGDPYTKKTCLWGTFNEPEMNPVEPTEGSKLWRMYGGKSDHTKTMRSITPPGFAQAFFKANR